MTRQSKTQFQKRVDKAIKRANVREILETIGVSFKARSNYDLWFRCHLRNHRNDRKASTHITDSPISEYHGIWKCFGCDNSGTIIDLVQEVRNVRFKEALMMVEHHQRDVDEMVVKPFYKGEVKLPNYYQCPLDFDDWDPKFLSYLVNRGISQSQILEHRIGYVDAGKYNDRIIVPVLLNYKLVTWVGRSINDNVELRITSPVGGKPGLFGSELSNPYEYPAIISEGWADALAIERLGFPNSMAVQTNRLHDSQFEVLERFKYVIVVQDADEGGDTFVDSLAQYIDRQSFIVTKLPRNSDPAALQSELLLEAIQKAEDWEPTEETHLVEIEY